MPENSIIVPTYNHVGLLKKCLASIKAHTDLGRTDVWVVANGSVDGTEEYVKSLGAPFNIISTPQPLGYTKAVNVGIAASSSKRLVLFNDDAEVLDFGTGDAWIRMLEQPFSDPSVAVTGASKDYWAVGKPFIVFFCAMMERQLLLSLGLLDETFNPGAGEDADFCLKALAMGLKSVQVPRDCDVWRTEFPIFHIGHMTCGLVPNWRDTAQRNTAILEDRYPRTEDDRQFQKAFSEGRQNVHLWSKAALQGVPSP